MKRKVLSRTDGQKGIEKGKTNIHLNEEASKIKSQSARISRVKTLCRSSNSIYKLFCIITLKKETTENIRKVNWNIYFLIHYILQTN